MSCPYKVIGYFLKRLCTCHISMAISIDQISSETKFKKKLISFLFLIQLKKLFWKYPDCFEENPGTNKSLIIAHLL